MQEDAFKNIKFFIFRKHSFDKAIQESKPNLTDSENDAALINQGSIVPILFSFVLQSR